jgi:universal stress protein A
MFKKILLPVDLSEKHQAALDVAAELAQQGQSEVTLLHVIEVIPGLSLEEEKSFYDRLERVARNHLKRLGDLLAERGIASRQEVLLGNRPREIARSATETGSDLIVLTAPRFDPDNPAAGWGSMSYRVGILSQCPVLLVK